MQSIARISKAFFFYLLLPIACCLLSCNEDDNPQPNPVLEIPSTYNFSNVNYSGQTQRLEMFLEMKNYIQTSQTGSPLDENTLLAMYANDPTAPWSNSYDATKQLRGKTLSVVQEDFDQLLIELAQASLSTEPGSEGIAGVVKSLDGSKSYLLGADGLDHAQVFEKALMGACLYYQATGVYLAAEKMNVDNETITDGEGTEMEHHWDEAFGYFGVPIDFPTNTDNLLFWGSYSNQRDAVLDSNKKLMDALLKGRAAISAKDLTTRDEAIAEARDHWELIAVGSALHYLNLAIANFDDLALRAHALSEAIGFIYALQFNPAQKVSNAQVADLLTLIAGSANFSQMNIYPVSITILTEAKNDLADYYTLSAKKDEF